ncbi:MAG: TIGR04552 family protein [Pseudomonadota bacterium]
MDENISFSFQNFAHLKNLSLNDLEAIRLILRGGSVVDWRRLNFDSRNEIDNFLSINGYNINNPKDTDRLYTLHRKALNYIEENFQYNMPGKVSNIDSVYDLFEMASDWKNFNRDQVLSCVVLKVMNIINHLEGRELLYTLPISFRSFSHIVTERVISRINELKQHHCPIVEISGGEKTKNSLITKLLLKKDTIAATVFDRLRFRLVVEKKSNIIPMLYHLTRELFPFNYIIPGESQNDLIDYIEFLQGDSYAQKYIKDLQVNIGLEEESKVIRLKEIMKKNPFSAKNFRTMNFVFDLPIKILDYFPEFEDRLDEETGYLVFALAEIQLIDAKTSDENERGEANHDKYSERKLEKAWNRLVKGTKEI